MEKISKNIDSIASEERFKRSLRNKEARRLSGMKQKDMAKYFYMPYRTYQDWELGNRVIPEYILRLVLYKLEMEKIIPSGLLESMDEK